MHHSFTKLATSGSHSPHLALQLPEVVDHVLSYLIVPARQDDLACRKTYRHLYECLFVNRMWHGCAARVIWQSVVFEDSKADYDAFIKFANLIGDSPVSMAFSSSTHLPSAATLAVAAPTTRPSLPDHRNDPLKPQPQSNGRRSCHHRHRSSTSTAAYPLQKTVSHSYESMDLDCNEDPLFIPSPHDKQSTRSVSHSENSHLGLHRGAIRSLTLRKIKDKTINEPLQQIGRHASKLDRLDIYICDHVTNSALYPFLAHARLTHLSLAGCHRISDEAILQVAAFCPQLEHLDLRACGLVSDVSISAVATQCPRLRHLNVGRVRDRDRITIASIQLIAMHTQVSVLGLAGCDMTDDCLTMLAQHRNAGIERISVNNCYRVTNKSVQAYVHYCPNLSVFEMKECHWIDDWEAVAELVQRKVLLTLCDQQTRACAEWARRRGRRMDVKAPLK